MGTGLVANIAYWEPSLQRCRAKTSHGKNKTPAAAINRSLDDMERTIDAVFLHYEEKGEIPTAAEFVAAYGLAADPAGGKPETLAADKPIAGFVDEYLRIGTSSGKWAAGTAARARVMRNHIRAFSTNLTLRKLVEGGPQPWIEYFGTVADNVKGEGLVNSTIKSDMAFLRAFLRWAQERGYCDAMPFLNQRMRLKTAERPVVFLEWDELMRVFDFDFGKKHYLAQVRDVFCFCCFTSLRYSDVHNLKRSNITDTELRITTIKTHDALTIELNKYSRAILARYEGKVMPDGHALPVISNQRMNTYLKEMGQICGLDAPITITRYKGARRYDTTYKKWELLTTHCGRRTFVCNALMLGIPADIVMQWTGHSDYKAMRPYVAIADGARRSAMAVFDHVPDPAKVGQKAGQKSDDG